MRAEFEATVPDVATDGGHLVRCGRLLARLRDGHAGLVDTKASWPDDSNGRRWTGPRVHLLVIGDTVCSRAAFGEAAIQGLKPGQSVTTIDGRPVREWLEATVTRRRDRNGYSTAHQALHAACLWGLADRSGTPTAGMSAARMTLPVPSGLFAARFAVRSHMQRWNKGRGLEGIGVTPTETLPYSPAELLSGVDTQIRRAEDLLQAGFPPEAVDYAPPALSAK